MMASRSPARWCGRSRGAEGEAAVVDADHVLGPLAGREVRALLEAHQPVVGVFGPNHEERRLLFADGEHPVNLRVRLFHR
jgi:hypothetical protein